MAETSNEELILALKEAASRLSYFNAAEGDQWAKERDARRAAHTTFYTMKEIAMERGIYDQDQFKHYLV